MKLKQNITAILLFVALVLSFSGLPVGAEQVDSTDGQASSLVSQTDSGTNSKTDSDTESNSNSSSTADGKASSKVDFADNLSSGSVGLGDGVVVMDSDGNSVSNSGEYFFSVAHMVPKQKYKKDIQIMNLSAGNTYRLYLYPEIIDTNGEIDLSKECTNIFTLDGEDIFTGRISGESDEKSISKESPLDLGTYKPDSSSKLTASITWDTEYTNDGGERIADSDGVHVIREPKRSKLEGEVTFKWIFYSVQLDEEVDPISKASSTPSKSSSTPSKPEEKYTSPKTGLFTEENMMIFAVALGCLIIGSIAIIISKKRKKKK